MTSRDHPRPATPTGKGRPRSEQVRAGILTATQELLIEKGINGVSVEDIATRAGASKATIYRWWPHKGAVALDACVDQVRGVVVFPVTDDLRDDLRREMRGLVRFMRTPSGRSVIDVLAYCRTDAVLGKGFRARIIEPSVAAARHRLEAAQHAGQLSDSIDLDVLIEALWGPIYHRQFVSNTPVTLRHVDQILDLVLEPHLIAA